MIISSKHPHQAPPSNAIEDQVDFCKAKESYFHLSADIASEKSLILAPQKLWKFSSDHFPVGASDDICRMASINLLSSACINRSESRGPISQGLKDSLIFEQHRLLDGEPVDGEQVKSFHRQNLKLFTQRDLDNIHLINQMLSHSSSPKNLLCLQEASPAFLNYLKEIRKLPEKYQIFADFDCPRVHTVALIINIEEFEVLQTDIVCVFNFYKHRYLMDFRIRPFSHPDIIYHILMTHLPGDPQNFIARNEFANYVLASMNDDRFLNDTYLIVGDMNFLPHELQEDFKQSAQLYGNKDHLTLTCVAPSYSTNIEPNSLLFKPIDHIWTNCPEHIRGLQPEEIVENQEFLETVEVCKQLQLAASFIPQSATKV